jgi:hypothetical protein
MAVIVVSCGLLSASFGLFGQTGPVVARAASVTGAAMLSGASGTFTLSAGFQLTPGDRIDTRGGGRVVIDLSDGSMVVIEPQSVVLLKDYRQAGSLRELLEITLGNVRVKINHFVGKPNPYRMNSPTASIAVRGTEFTVDVSAGGDTRVVVYEGVVEVISLSDPSHSILVEAGRGVLVQAGQDFHLLAGNSNPPAGRRDTDGGDHHGARESPGAESLASNQSHSGVEGATQRSIASSSYDNYVASLSDLLQTPFLFRYNAFAEPHLDSLENPAYATQFENPEARFFLLPTIGGGPDLDDNPFGPAGARTSDYSVTPQISMFSPIGKSGFVIGGGVSYTRASNNAERMAADEDPVLPGQSPAFKSLAGNSNSNFFTGSVVLARMMGEAGSFGIEAESLHGNGSLTSTTSDTDVGTTLLEQIFSRSGISQTRLTAGYSRKLPAHARLGVFYRYGLISANDHDLSHTLNGKPLTLNSTDTTGHSSEIGFRLRGALTPKFIYGFTGSWVNVSLADELVRIHVVNSHEQDRAQRGSAGFGMGYALNRRTIFIFDLDGGTSRVAASRFEAATGNTLQNGTSNSHFVSAHEALQFDVSRRVFVSAAYIHVWSDQHLSINLFPNQIGVVSMVQDSFFPVTPNAWRYPWHSSDFGIGWRFSRDLFLQYLFTTTYDVTTPNHSLMLRYTFRFHGD